VRLRRTRKQNFGIGMRRAPKMNWVKALLLLSCLLVGYADLVTTNVILNHGLGELNSIQYEG
jgi:hypothetical protein